MIRRIEICIKESNSKTPTVDVYTINKKLSADQLRKIAAALANPIVQQVSFNKPLSPSKFSWAVEIGFLPGVTDNVGSTAKELIEDLLKIKFAQDEGVYFSKVYFFITKPNISELHNPLIQRVSVKSRSQFKTDRGMDKITPQVKLNYSIKVNEVDLNVSDEKLMEISRRGTLALDILHLKTIQAYFKKLKRNPTDIELESIAQTWSEHCKHTIFADPIDEIKDGLYKTYIKGATAKIKSPICVSVFTDNSGIIKFDKNYLITHKVETHNSPSALDPFGGAVTGIVGVNRDTIGTGMGAKPVINFYGFCLADPKDKTELFRDRARKQKMLSARRIMDGVIEGVNAGGNQSGIPTPQGFLYFHKKYRGKPLVFAGTVGLLPRKVAGKLSHIKKAKAGDYIVMVGGRVGLDGIHGATFSSVTLDSGSPVTAVQIGDPITQKKLSDALIKEVRDRGLYSSITDDGAGGLSCSVAEMAKESGGCVVDLEKVPLKYPGLSPWQIWISESQERMTLAIPPKNWQKFNSLMKRRGVEATVIGKFTDSGNCIVQYKGKKIMDLEMKFLHNGLPKRQMKTKKPATGPVLVSLPPVLSDVARVSGALPLGHPSNRKIKKNWHLRSLINNLKDLNITSYEFLSRQYDHEVQGGSVLKPLQGKGKVNANSTVTRPVLNSSKGVVLSQALYPEYSEVDAYYMAACAIDTAIRNAIAVGGSLDHLALLDNFCWCSSNDPTRLYQLKEAARACYDYAVAYGTPFISGKDSMFNDFKGYDAKGRPIKISIPPTLLISSIGVIKDVTKAVSLDFKFLGDLIYILGRPTWKVEAVENKKLYQGLAKCIEKGLITSSLSVTRGGLAVALAKSAMGGMLGIEVSTNRDLFLTTQGQILVSINPTNQVVFEKMMHGNYLKNIGQVRGDQKFIIKNRGKITIKADVSKLLKNYKSTFGSY